MFALPYDGETTGLLYRTDLFQAAGITSPPKTWEELQAAAVKLTDPAKKQYGFILFAPEAQYYWLPFLWQADGNLLSKDGKTITFNSPQGVQAADFYIGLRRYAPPDFLASNSWDGRVAFATGRVAMYEAGAWFGGEMAQSFPKIKGKWSVAPMPTGPARCPTTIAATLIVTSQSKNKDAAWLWIEFLSRSDNMKLWTFGTPTATLLPPRHPDYHLPEVPLGRLVGQVEAVLRQARPQLVVSLGPDGLTSHHDHVRAGEAAAEAFARARAAEGKPDDALLRLYQAAYPRTDVDRFYAGVRRGGFGYGEEGRLFDVTGVPDERIAVRVDTRAVAERKWAAILRHRTQLEEHERIPEPLRWIVLDAECFVQAFPPRAPGGAVLGDLLAGLAP